LWNNTTQGLGKLQESTGENTFNTGAQTKNEVIMMMIIIIMIIIIIPLTEISFIVKK
jgi:hypothetical protein